MTFPATEDIRQQTEAYRRVMGTRRHGVTALRKAGKISHADAASAERWYQDYALGVHGVFDSDPALGRGGGGGDAHTAQFARAKGSLSFREACQAVGQHGTEILTQFVVNGLTLAALGKLMSIHNSEATGAVVATLRRLTEHYAASAPIGRVNENIISADFSSCTITKDLS
jgi:hypothetical protein